MSGTSENEVFYIICVLEGSVAGWAGWRGSQASGPATVPLSLKGAGKGQLFHSVAVLSEHFHLLPHLWLKIKHQKIMISWRQRGKKHLQNQIEKIKARVGPRVIHYKKCKTRKQPCPDSQGLSPFSDVTPSTIT